MYYCSTGEIFEIQLNISDNNVNYNIILSTPDAATTRIKTEISIDLSVGNDGCAAANCDNCQALFGGHLCTCPQGQTLQGDGSCARKRKWKGKWKKKWNTK